MRFNLDENLPRDLAEVLRSTGHDALTVVDQNLRGHMVEASGMAAALTRTRKPLGTYHLAAADQNSCPPHCISPVGGNVAFSCPGR
jgi:hypothetical protein